MSDIVFLSGKRTPFGTFNGVFTDISAIDLGVIAGKAAIEQAGVSPSDIDHVIFGNVMQTSPDAIYGARHIGLKCDVPIPVPAVTVNRLCGSGFESLAQASQLLRLGEATMVLAGGAENMTQSPHTIRGARKGFRLGGTKMNDYLQEVLFDTQAGCQMAITAENLAEKYGISREDADDYGFRSQTAFDAALKAGKYADEIVPVTLKTRKGDRVVEVDEHPQLSPLAPERFRARFSREAMAKLRPIFKKDGTVTAANASGINDGAGAMVMTTAAVAEQRGLAPIGRLVSSASVGVEPKLMGIGPVAAIQTALKRAGMSIGQMELIEINEAFSSQYLACERELGVDRAITNVNSGGVAVGHPLAATGTRITMHLIYELRRRGLKYGVGSACIGGGQGIAVVVEAF
ncbi:MAG: acetyl-CoA C-acyltransferase [Deltaproteobacteria bacterium]|mgnify:CR=1 FL=1|nr:acetyl-CoA C-acyltransferase [Deltaproteobacteria bacterium]HCH63903.1 acetyl-CoA C-acyltransferase [Deltaproteobacteria bacterium]